MLNYAQRQYEEALDQVGVPDKEPEIADEELDSDIDQEEQEQDDGDEEEQEDEEDGISEFVEAYDDDIMGEDELEDCKYLMLVPSYFFSAVSTSCPLFVCVCVCVCVCVLIFRMSYHLFVTIV